MELPDVNLLLYAIQGRAPSHAVARLRLEVAFDSAFARAVVCDFDRDFDRDFARFAGLRFEHLHA